MTQHDQRLLNLLLFEIGDLTPQQAITHLYNRGLIDQRRCEQRAIRSEIERLEREEKIPRCEAMQVAAETFCCSHEKARSAFYNTIKS